MDSASVYEAMLNSLHEQIALIEPSGTILYVNQAWKQFGISNGLSPDFDSVGTNYLQVCGAAAENDDSPMAEVIRGIQRVANGALDSFYHEYPCHSPDAKRWFLMRVSPVKGDHRPLLVVSHHDITKRKLAEQHAEHLARHDPLTGLPNRLHFDEFLANEWRRSLRGKEPISLIMLDLDYFKDYNDQFGHPAGDQCLKKVAQVLRAAANRATDIAVRYGGEEFAVLLGKTNERETRRVAEKIRRGVDNLNLQYGRAQQLSISAGVASVIPDHGQDTFALLQKADRALYAAKRQGRNCVV